MVVLSDDCNEFTTVNAESMAAIILILGHHNRGGPWTGGGADDALVKHFCIWRSSS